MKLFDIRYLGLYVCFWAATVPGAEAGERAAHFREALEKTKGTNKDIAVLFYGSDWCRVGEPWAKHWQAEGFEKQVGEVVLVGIDRKESPTEEDKALAKANEACAVSPRSLPALALFDAQGRLVAIREGMPELSGTGKPEEWLKKAVRVREERDALWKRGEKMGGPEKAKLLGEGLDRMSLGLGPKQVYKPVLDELVKADPENRTGYKAKYTFPGRKLLDQAVDSAKAGKFKEADDEIQSWLRMAGLTKAQRQEALAARFALYQRWPEKKGESPKVMGEIERIDPRSDLGQAAKAYRDLLEKEGKKKG